MVDEGAVWDALREVNDPELNRSLVELKMIRRVEVEGGTVRVTVALTVAGCPMRSVIRQAVEERLGQVPGVDRVEVELTAMTEEERRELFGPALEKAPALATGARAIAVASGKGGVGKSTVAVNLAAALAAEGLQVGLLDADIYGFSVARLMGLTGEPGYDAEQRLLPFVAHGVKTVSMGSFVAEGMPVIWRGPLLRQTLHQFLAEVAWGPLDFLVIDMPPGTGDVALDVAKMIPDSLVVLVTTPEPLAAAVASRMAQLARRTGQTLLGVVENMSYFACPHCGERSPVFGEGGGRKLAETLEVPLLGQLPIASPRSSPPPAGAPLPASLGPAGDEILRAIAREVRRLAGAN